MGNINDIRKLVEEQGKDVHDLKLTAHPDSRFQSFKRTVGKSAFKPLLNPAIWPEGIVVRPFSRPSPEIRKGDK